MSGRVFVTGVGAISAAGRTPEEIWQRALDGRSAIAPVRQWESARWPTPLAGEIADFDARALVEDRKIHKLLRRTDFLGLYAAGAAIGAAGLVPFREGLGADAREAFDDGTAVYVGAGGAAYHDQYEFLPALAAAGGDAGAFGREAGDRVSPLWLLRSLPNNVLCHVGIHYGYRGPNGCFTSHNVSGALAAIEAAEAVRAAEADRALAVAHDSPIEPEAILHLDAIGLLGREAVRPFDRARTGCLVGEGGGALVFEAEAAARQRGAPILAEYLGGASVCEGDGLLPVRDDGDGLERAIRLALDDARLEPEAVGMIVAHGNGTAHSDASEARALGRVFGADPPPATAWKWAIGHLFAASALVETTLALCSLQRGALPGVGTLRELDPACAGVRVSNKAQRPRADTALVLNRGFAGANAALVFRGTEGRT